jgi:hypothetical protein
MNMTDELVRLSKLHEEGALNAEEFAQAKRRLLDSPENPTPSDSDRRLAEAANFFVTLEKVKVNVGLVLFLICICIGFFVFVMAKNSQRI